MTGVGTKSRISYARIVLLESFEDSLLVPMGYHIYLHPSLISVCMCEWCYWHPSFTFATSSKMIGMLMNFLGKGLPTAQVLGLVMGTLHKEFVKQNVKTFEDFHMAILDIFSTVNAALPGKHYDPPSVEDVEECFEKWEKETEERKQKEIVINFMKKHVNLNQLDEITLITGIVTPPAAMVVKRAGESIPQLKLIKNLPDVIFVPTATILALVSVKLSRRMFLRHVEE